MLIVGLTGGIGAGKTTLSEALARRGAVVIDIDGLGRQVIGHGGSVVDDVVARFGEDVRSEHGDIDRVRLAELVFDDEDAMAALTAISHPAINNLIDAAIDSIIGGDSSGNGVVDETIVVLDMAVLVESALGWDNKHRYEVVVTVEAPLHLRLERLERRGLSLTDAEARIAAQATDEQRREAAQFVVTNGGTIEDLNNTAGEVWAELQRLHAEKLG